MFSYVLTKYANLWMFSHMAHHFQSKVDVFEITSQPALRQRFQGHSNKTKQKQNKK